MSNLVKHSQLKEVSLDLWNKAKERTNGAFKTATYDEATQTITFTKVDNSEVTVNLTDLASKESDNIFIGKNVFDDLFVGGESEVVGGSVPAGNRGGAVGTKKFGHRGYDSHTNNGNGYVNSLLIGVTKDVGATAEVSVWEVKKGSTRNDDIPTLVASNVQLAVKGDAPWENTSGNRNYVEFLVNKTYNSPTYFIYQVHPSTEADRVISTDGDNNDYILIGDDTDVTQQNIAGLSSFNIVGVHALKRGEINIIDLITSGGSVKTVNNQMADGQGNVTVGIEHINGLRAELDSKVDDSEVSLTAVANMIPRLGADGKLDTNMIPELAITRIKRANTKQEALGLVGDSTEAGLQTGDVVVIIGEKNAIFMYNGGTSGNFDDDFIKLSIGDGTIKIINGQTPDGTGAVTLNASHFNDIYSKTESDAKYYAWTENQITNANDFKTPGIARTKSDTSNLPSATNSKWGVIQFLRENTNIGVQLWYSTDGNSKGQIWTRSVSGTTWSEWKRLATTDDVSGVVKTVNDQTPNASGAVTITANQIKLSNNTDILENELNNKVKTIGGQVAQNGNIDLTLELGTDKYELQANGTKIAELPLMTEAELQEIKDLFV